MAPGSAKRVFRVIGYLPEYRLETVDLSVASHVTDLIFFSIEPHPSGQLDLERLTPEVEARLRQIRERYGTRLLICVGGWGRSGGFGRMATALSARQRFVEGLVALCRQRGFSGADFDWEFPVDEAERWAYAALLAEVKQAFQSHGMEVSVALSPAQRLDELGFQVVDRVHLMAYDQGTRHATFEDATAGAEGLMDRGVPLGKICLGVPFYGRSIEDRDVAMTYADIVRLHRPDPAADEAGGVYFNGIETIERKVRYARDRGLAGVMIWELGQDTHDEWSLLRAIHRVAGG